MIAYIRVHYYIHSSDWWPLNIIHYIKAHTVIYETRTKRKKTMHLYWFSTTGFLTIFWRKEKKNHFFPLEIECLMVQCWNSIWDYLSSFVELSWWGIPLQKSSIATFLFMQKSFFFCFSNSLLTLNVVVSSQKSSCHSVRLAQLSVLNPRSRRAFSWF